MALQRLRFSVFGMIAVIAASLPGPVSAGDLYDAAKARDVTRVLMLLNSGADPNQHSPYDGPLHLAARLGPPEIVTALLDAGADIELPGYGGIHPLHAAALAGQKKIVSILIKRRAKVDALDNLGRTPLISFLSGASEDLQILKILLVAGANPNALDGAFPIYALDYAAMLGRADEADLLIAAGADVNSRDSLYGKSPLHFAIDCSNTCHTGNLGVQEVVQRLIDHGADVNARDNSGLTPLDYAKHYEPNNGLLQAILIEAGAK